MAVICPTITAFDTNRYREQIERVKPFAQQVHIDLMDGEFAPTKSPDLSQVWWPPELLADIHLMYQRPMDYLKQLVELKPHMVIIHAEAEVDHNEFARILHEHNVRVGLALLQDTQVQSVQSIIPSFDQVLVFSGDLGKHGGVANLGLLTKVDEIAGLHPSMEIAWDGGINADNAQELMNHGVEILNVGGYIQAADDPAVSYEQLVSYNH